MIMVTPFLNITLLMWKQFFSVQVSYDTPTIPNEKNFAYVKSRKISVLIDHEKNALCDGYIDESIHDTTENYYERGTYDS